MLNPKNSDTLRAVYQFGRYARPKNWYSKNSGKNKNPP